MVEMFSKEKDMDSGYQESLSNMEKTHLRIKS